MNDLDPEVLADLVVGTIKAALGPLEVRLSVLEKREPLHGRDGLPGVPGPPGKDGRDGKDTAVDAKQLTDQVAVALSPIELRIKSLEERESQPGPVGPPGKDGIDGRIGPIGPPDRDGTDADVTRLAALDATIETLRAELAAVKALQIPMPDVSGLVTAEVTKAVARLPAPKDGRDGASLTVADVQPLIAVEVAKAIERVPPPKDGVGIIGALISDAGELVLTFTDGTTKSVGRVVGAPGRDGRDGIPGKPGRDGEKGADGLDGLGFDDLDYEFDGERRLSFVFVRGDRKKSLGPIVFRTVIDRGVWQAGKRYEPQDGVTWAGSFWIAQEATDAKPGAGATPWRLAVKSGRDGKDGKDGRDGVKGADGRPGKDALQPWKS